MANGATKILVMAVVTILMASGCVDPSTTAPGTTEAAPEPEQSSSAAVAAVGPWTGRSGIAFSMDVPTQWSDITDAYYEEVGDSVLAAFFALTPDLDADTGFATVSTDVVGEDTFPRAEVFADLDGWASDMTSPVSGPNGGIQTAAGGAGWWGSVTGELRGRVTTIHSIHLNHGGYELMVLIESYEGEDADVEDLLSSLETVTFTAPEPIEGRQGAPAEEQGSWQSYCGGVAVAAQDWDYDFIPWEDGAPRDCSGTYDYVGGWLVTAESRVFSVSAAWYEGSTQAALREEFSIPASVGESITSPNGYQFTLVEERSVGDESKPAEMVSVTVTTPSGTVVPQVIYLVELSGGTALFAASPAEQPGDFEAPWLEEFALSVRESGGA